MAHFDRTIRPIPNSNKATQWRPPTRIIVLTLIAVLGNAVAAVASEADLAIPDLREGHFASLGGISAWNLLAIGALVICGTQSW